jgi:MFS family permease
MTANTLSENSTSDASEITKYQKLVLLSAFLGWMFDSMDLNIFTLILFPCIKELIQSTNPAEIAKIGSIVIAIKLFAWGIGGVVFGVVADRYGRAKTMALTVLIYALFTGLSAFATSWEMLAFFQALAGIGIGGEWAAGAAIIAETWPAKNRARAIQVMQLAFAIGFFLAAINNLVLGQFGWRWVIGVGVIPVFLTIIIRRYVKEPERWIKVSEERKNSPQEDSNWKIFSAIFSKPHLRNTIIGVTVASAAMLGCWAGLSLMPTWIMQLTTTAKAGNPVTMVSYAFMLMMVGAFAGYVSLIWLSDFLGRRKCYFLFWSLALVSSLYLFTQVNDIYTLLWFMPIYGYFVIGGFGTFATYLPELFPTRVRGTGQGFCWNMARFLTGFGPLSAGFLIQSMGSIPKVAATLSLLFIIGLIAIWFGPETKGIPLED